MSSASRRNPHRSHLGFDHIHGGQAPTGGTPHRRAAAAPPLLSARRKRPVHENHRCAGAPGVYGKVGHFSTLALKGHNMAGRSRVGWDIGPNGYVNPRVRDTRVRLSAPPPDECEQAKHQHDDDHAEQGHMRCDRDLDRRADRRVDRDAENAVIGPGDP